MGRPANLVIRIISDAKSAAEDLDKVQGKLDGLNRAGNFAAITGAALSLGAALVPVAAAATATGAAFAGLGIAVVPQFKAITEASQTLALAQKQQAEGSASAAKTMALYQQQVAGMPQATRDTASALADLTTATHKWSDSLAPETMPIFTQGINGLQAALPALTPLVNAAARAVAPFVAQFEAEAKSGAILKVTTRLADMASRVLPSLIGAAVQFGKGFGNVLLSLGKPAADFSDQLERWGTQFAALTGPTRDNGDGISKFAEACDHAGKTLVPLIEAVLRLVSNMGPLLGATTLLVQGFAAIINAVPTPVLQILGPALIATAIAVRTMTIAVAALDLAMVVLESPVLAIIAAVALVAAGAIYAYTHFKTFHDVVDTLTSIIVTCIRIALTPYKVAFQAVADVVTYLYDKAIRPLIDWLGRIAVPAAIGAMRDAFNGVKDAVQFVIDKIKEMGDLLSHLPGAGVIKSIVGKINPFSMLALPPAAAGQLARDASTYAGRETLMAATNINFSIMIDGQQLQGRITRTVDGALTRDGARLATSGWY
ncbi:hypothetical protein [Catenulispora pinisilvae]|uniref:hypothetical protein n=1 Tax=Catenulispora pinisilvae TaxID=2705253 RepID=UPI0018926442|nr:hypothetical protein [Catenulispora pinisilvae]